LGKRGKSGVTPERFKDTQSPEIGGQKGGGTIQRGVKEEGTLIDRKFA